MDTAEHVVVDVLMLKNRVPVARLGATGAVLMLVLALIVQFTITPAALASVGQDPVAQMIAVVLPDGQVCPLLFFALK